MKRSIFLAINHSSQIKKKVVNNIVESLNSCNSIDLKYDIKKLIYKSYEDIIGALTRNRNRFNNLIIFSRLPLRF